MLHQRHLTRALALLMGLACGCGSAFPALLTSTVHRVEEQGIDYSSTGTSTLEITLSGDGRGRAIRTTHASDVLEVDVHRTDDAAVYDVVAEQRGDRLTLVLTPQAGQSPLTTRAELSCEPWTSSSRGEPSAASDPTLPGVEWVCALLGEDIFALGGVVIQHVPREGSFILFAGTHQLVIRESVSGAQREVTTEPGPPR